MQARRKAVDPPVATRSQPVTLPKPENAEVLALRAKLNTKTEQLSEAKGRYTSKHPQVVKLTREVEQLEGQLREANAAVLPDASIPAPESSAGNQQVRTETEVRVDNSADFEEPTGLRVQLEGIKAEIDALQKEHEYLVTQIRIYENRRVGAPRVEQELAALTREHEVLKQQHREIQQKKFNSQVAANLETSAKNETLKIIDEAYLPEKPIGPPRRKIAAIGIAAGVLLGLAIVVGLEGVNSTIADENQAARELGLPILVSIHRISVKEMGLHRKLRKVKSGRQVLPL
jgi:uncharacterized protein involved in exopolysaccharide biosynthesis